ncbi:MAG TPA: NEW3 domain-containing protein [Candidatus Binatia bacterium]|nr:NEW3 domain-containing protein [Candidatus Binatia bacterium]
MSTHEDAPTAEIAVPVPVLHDALTPSSRVGVARRFPSEMPSRRSRRRPAGGVLRPVLAAAAAAMVAAGALAPAVLAQGGLTISTDYPSVAVAPGSKVSFNLKLTVDEPRRVALSVSGVPQGWEASLLGGGYVVDAVQATPNSTPSVRLDVTVPADAAARTYTFAVTASSGSLSDRLELSVRVNPEAAGSVSLESDFPTLQGPASATYRFSVRLRNDTPEDLTFGLGAQGPTGWTVSARPSGQSQAASATVTAGSSTTLNVEADPPDNVEAGTYRILVTASAGSRTAQTELTVEITGTYRMTITTPDGRLNASGTAGSVITRQLVIRNDGTAPLQGVTLSATPPSGWTVEFDPETVDVPAGQEVQVTARITPQSDALAGDYVVTFRASTQQANASEDIRVTIETSLTWALVGIALIVATLAGLGWVFSRYGRR